MPYYRLFFLDRAAHVAHVEVVSSPNDAQVIDVVRRLLDDRPSYDFPALHIWQADRLVGHLNLSALKGGGEPPPGAPVEAPFVTAAM